eukprot:913173-Ditylum_brightwellii.AAC.1
MILLDSPVVLESFLQQMGTFPQCSCSEQQLNVLSKHNAKFSLQNIFHRFHKKNSANACIDLDVEVDRFLTLMKKHPISPTAVSAANEVSSKSIANGRPDLSDNLLSIDSRAQLAGLDHLKNVLKHFKDTKNESISCQTLYNLLCELIAICDSHTSDDVRIAASCCLGELGAFDLNSLSILDLDLSGPLR